MKKCVAVETKRDSRQARGDGTGRQAGTSRAPHLLWSHNLQQNNKLSQNTREIFDIRMAMFDGATAFLPHPVTTPGVLPFWAFLERVERVPLAGGASRPGPRERRLSSVRNTVGAVASLSKVSTPLGRARAWIRQCLVSKCLEACVAALLDEERLVKVREIEREREAKRGGPDGFVYFAVVLVLFVRPAHRRVPWRGGCVLSRGLPQGQPPMSGCFVAAL